MRRDLFMFIISCSAVSLQALLPPATSLPLPLLPCAQQAEVVGEKVHR